MTQDDTPLSDFVRSRGRSLRELGMREVAFAREDALQLLDLIKSRTLVVLGGDVFAERRGRLSQSGESWFFNPEPAKPREQNAGESAERARSYIKRFQSLDGSDSFFSFVIDGVDLDDILHPEKA